MGIDERSDDRAELIQTFDRYQRGNKQTVEVRRTFPMESRKFREQENPTRFVDLNAEERTRFGMTMKLYIIGNGFDIHHGIPSHYREFGKFLAARDQETLDLVNRYFAVEDDFWFEFEDRLATFDADTLIEEASDFLASYATEDWSDAFHHDYEYEVGKVVKRPHARALSRALGFDDPPGTAAASDFDCVTIPDGQGGAITHCE